jgi:hypothetical protein
VKSKRPHLQRNGEYRAAGRNTMSSHIMSYVQAVAVGLCTTVAMGANWAVASDDCLAQPNRQPGQGGHWYYRLDRVDKRKCWHLEGSGATPRDAGVTVGRPSLDTPTLSSVFSLLATDFLGATAAKAQQDATSKDAHELHHVAEDRRSSDSGVRQPRLARYSDSNTAPEARSHRPSSAPPRAKSMGQSSALGQPERDALFQDFLRWRARETP